MATRGLRNSAVCLPLAILAGVAGVATICQRTWAQSPNELRKILENNAPSAAELQALDNYFNNFFKKFKQPKSGDELPKSRKDYGNIVRGIPATTAHKHLNTLVLTELRTILMGRYPRVVKYNAMLMIADLNESDETRSPKPSPDAFKILLQALNAPAEWDYLKPAALVGLARFAEDGGIPKDRTAQVSETLLALVNEKNPQAGRNASTHNFLRRSAARALAAMRSTGPGNSVVKAFEDIAADSKARPTLRCEIARYIGALTYPPEAKVDLQRLANILGHQTVEICRQELDRSKDKGDASRRLVLYVLDSSNEGLQKLSNSADGDAKKFIYDLKKKVETLFQDLDNTEKTPDGDVASLVQTEITNIEGTLLPKPEPEPLGPKAEPTKSASTN